MKKSKVIVLYGGQSTEHEISQRSARFVVDNIDKEKYEVIPVAIAKNGQWLVQDLQILLRSSEKYLPISLDTEQVSLFDLGQTCEQEPVVVFPVLHGTKGEDGAPQGFFELRNWAYVGPGVLGSAIAMDKEIAKILVANAGLKIAPYHTINRRAWLEDSKACLGAIAQKLSLPVYVKPASLGSSVGITKVTEEAGLTPAIKEALDYDTKILIESEVHGREIEFAALGGDQVEISEPGEVVASSGFYSYEEKYSSESTSEVVIPAEMPEEHRQAGRDQAKTAFQALNLHGMSRVDFFYTAEGEFVFNEANTIPGFTSISQYPKLWAHSGIDGKHLIDRLIAVALERWQTQQGLQRSIEPNL